MADNYARMMEVINTVFRYEEDEDQLQVDDAMMERLARLHPRTMNELKDDDGPIVWVLVIPTTKDVMTDFLEGRIKENALVDRTPETGPYTCIYLCSASVLPEHRRQGLARKLVLEAIEAMRADNPIDTLFYWPLTAEGEMLAQSVSQQTGLPLLVKAH